MDTLQKVILPLTFLILSITSKGQVIEYQMRQDVLEKSIIDSLFIFGKWTENGQTETHLKYLGQVTSKSGRTFKVLNSCSFWGLSRRATTRILIYNQKNQYLGSYNLSMTYELPRQMHNGLLLFTNVESSDCDKRLTTAIDLTLGLPRQIFIKCNGEFGDPYSFSAD